MSTKQLRLSDAAQIRTRLKSFLGKKINIVMLDSTTLFGILKEVTDADFILANMRLKKIRYQISNISEIYLDTPS
jgi:ferredoxin-fold anticodon binding domain-containing protein